MKSKHATQTTINSISHMNKYKMLLSAVSEGIPVVPFKPLKAWPAQDHPRQAELDAYRAGAVVIWRDMTVLQFGKAIILPAPAK